MTDLKEKLSSAEKEIMGFHYMFLTILLIILIVSVPFMIFTNSDLEYKFYTYLIAIPILVFRWINYVKGEEESLLSACQQIYSNASDFKLYIFFPVIGVIILFPFIAFIEVNGNMDMFLPTLRNILFLSITGMLGIYIYFIMRVRNLKSDIKEESEKEKIEERENERERISHAQTENNITYVQLNSNSRKEKSSESKENNSGINNLYKRQIPSPETFKLIKKFAIDYGPNCLGTQRNDSNVSSDFIEKLLKKYEHDSRLIAFKIKDVYKENPISMSKGTLKDRLNDQPLRDLWLPSDDEYKK